MIGFAIAVVVTLGVDQTPLPRVLLIGDSISQGYTAPVRDLLFGEAVVERIQDAETGGNARHTRCGLARLDAWLGDTGYDVIHFNWGLWDLCYRRSKDAVGGKDKRNGVLATPLDEYRENLAELMRRLERTGAVLVLATTTPVPDGEPGRVAGSEVAYNDVATDIARRFGIRVDDLHAHVGDRMVELQVRPNDVHFTREGSRFLAEAVVDSIRGALAGRRYRRIRDGLRRSFDALSAGGDRRVAFLGGSITHNPGWRDRIGEFLARRFPDASIDLLNAGIPSMGSTPGAFRLHRDVLSKGPVDLLFVEAAVNDSTNGRTEVEQLRGMAGIVRHVRRDSPTTDVVMMHFVDPGKMASYRRGEVPPVIAVHEEVAERYGVTSLHLAQEVTERIDRGEFTWEDDFRDLHPSPFGQELYFRSVRDLLQVAWRVGDGETSSLPEAIDAQCYDRGRLGDVHDAIDRRGFVVDPRWRPEHGGTRRGYVDVPMLVGEEPGASFRLPFRGRSIGLLVVAGPDAGVVEVRIDGGPARQVNLFTRWSRGLHLPFSTMLDADLDDGPHILELTIARGADEWSRGHAVRVAAFLRDAAP